jgi:hypothetical protein
MSDEVCRNCVYWEENSRGWGRCWAPDSDGEYLGIQLISSGNAFLQTADTFGCSAWAEAEEEDPDEWSAEDS